ncbi:MAG: hypothetical protein KDA78_07220 [Planctomycetaceae bacterium]|nr:hypothetical protein [Planctomycetaceae bacterium]
MSPVDTILGDSAGKGIAEAVEFFCEPESQCIVSGWEREFNFRTEFTNPQRDFLRNVRNSSDVFPVWKEETASP